MKRIRLRSLAGVIALLVAGHVAIPSADAADLPLVTKAMPTAAPYNWTGSYIGGQVGYAWGNSFQAGANGFGSTGNYNVSGVVGGGTIGYNWGFGPNWVVGAETDFSGAGIRGTGATAPTYACLGGCETMVQWFGTARGRVGYAIDNVLLYGTGGWAYGRATADIVGCPGGICGSNNVNGWTAGAGVEYGFARSWSAKVEYLHVDMGQFNFTNAGGCAATGGCVSLARFDLVRVGFNYRFDGFLSPSPALVTK